MAAIAVAPQGGGNISTTQIMSHDIIFQKIQEVLPDCIASDDLEPFLEIFDSKLR